MKKIIIFILTLLLTGCYNYTELNNLDLVSSIYITYSNNNYNIKLEKLNDNSILESNCTSINECLNKFELNNNKKLNYSHLNVLFLNNEKNIDNILKYFLRNTETNITFYICLTNDNPYLNKNIGTFTKNILKKINFTNFIDITKEYYDYNNLFLPILNNNKIETFYLNKKILNLDEYYIYNLLHNKNNETFTIPCNNNFFVLNINKVNKTNNELKLESTIKEFNCSLDTTNTKDILKLEELSNSYISNSIKNYNNLNIKVNNHINKKGLILK